MLDFSHLTEKGIDTLLPHPLKMRSARCVSCSDRRRSQRSLKWTLCRFLANSLRPDALPSGAWTHSSSCAGGSRRLTQRHFAGWLRRRTRKKSHDPYETLDRCALIRSAMAKVERYET